MRFLLDENQSPLLVGLLAAFGHDVVHVRDLGLADASDAALLEVASREVQVLASGDTDFGELLARSNASGPSLILLRRQSGRRAAQVAALISANLDAVVEDLDAGAIEVKQADRAKRGAQERPPSDPGWFGAFSWCALWWVHTEHHADGSPHGGPPKAHHSAGLIPLQRSEGCCTTSPRIRPRRKDEDRRSE